jgi:hypothetical protein
MTVKTRGRTPKWCSSSCRHRAWEQSRAAANGQVAVRIVDRRVVLERAVAVVEHHRVEVLPHDGAGWADALDELAEQIAAPTGRIADRDLGTLMRGLQHAAHVIDQRPGWRNGRWH